PAVLTQQIPIVTPVRTRLVEWGRSGNGDSRNPATGQCTPDCPEFAVFPWTVKVNGGDAHSMNANRISLLVPKPGEIEHWTYVNGGGWVGSPDPSPLRGRRDHEPRFQSHSGNRKPGPKRRLAAAGGRPGDLPGAVRGIWRLLCEPLPQHGARGLRSAHADPVPHRRHGLAAGHGDADAQSISRRRDLHDAGNPA